MTLLSNVCQGQGQHVRVKDEKYLSAASTVVGTNFFRFYLLTGGLDQPNLDLSEFPTLGNRSSAPPNPQPIARNYGKNLTTYFSYFNANIYHRFSQCIKVTCSSNNEANPKDIDEY